MSWGGTAPAVGGLPPADPPPVSGPALLYQQWRSVVFLHWEVDPDAVARRLPPGTRPDLLDGKAYAAVVAFLMPTTRLLGRVPVGATVEVNTRVYSVDADGRHGTVFLSMDVSLATMALAGRVLARLPYAWSATEVVSQGDTEGYRCRRRLPSGDVNTVVNVRPGEAIDDPSPLDQFVTARWFLHQRHLLGTYCLPVTHVRWPLHRAELVQGDDGLLRSAGLTPLGDGGPVSVLWSPGVDAWFHPLVRG